MAPRLCSRLCSLRTACVLAAAAALSCTAQSSTRLSLQDATATALRNHPQVLVARNEVAYQGQQTLEARSAYLPAINGDITGSQANHDARIGAGSLTDSRLFNRIGQGISFSQLITDFGRTSNLVASSRLQEKAAGETYEATRDDVIRGVNGAYYAALRAQAVVNVARQTLSTRQVVLDQASELAKNNLKSQLDVSFADATVSEAKLLLLRAQNESESAFAELARALGSDQAVAYDLVEEPLPAAPPAKPDDLIAQAIANRPELASLRYSRDSAYKFADAEKDLRRPTVSLTGVAGYIPISASSGRRPFPPSTRPRPSTFTFRSTTAARFRRAMKPLTTARSNRMNGCATSRSLSRAMCAWRGAMLPPRSSGSALPRSFSIRQPRV